MLASFILPVLLVRVMSQSDYGVFSQFYTIYNAFYVILAFGVHSNLFYFYPACPKNEKKYYITNTFYVLLFFGVITFVIAILTGSHHIFLNDDGFAGCSYLVLLVISLSVPMNIVSPMNTVIEDKWGAILFPSLIAVLRVIIIILCAVYFKSIKSILIGLCLYQVVVCISIALYVHIGRGFLRLDVSKLKSQLIYSIPFGIAVILQVGSTYFDKFVCMRYLSYSDFAVYSVAFLSIPGINQVYESLCQVNICNMSNSYMQNKISEIKEQYNDFVIKTVSFSTPIIVICAVFAEEIISFLYTSEYLAAASYFRLYTLSYIVSMLGAGTILRAMGKTKLSLLAYFVTFIIVVPITYLMVKNYGARGAIFSALINTLLPRIVQLFMEAKQLSISIKNFLPWKSLVIIVLPALIVGMLLFIIKSRIHISLFFVIGISVLYVIALYLYYIYKSLFIVKWQQIKNYVGKN